MSYPHLIAALIRRCVRAGQTGETGGGGSGGGGGIKMVYSSGSRAKGNALIERFYFRTLNDLKNSKKMISNDRPARSHSPRIPVAHRCVSNFDLL